MLKPKQKGDYKFLSNPTIRERTEIYGYGMFSVCRQEREREIFDSHSLHVHTLLMLYALHCGLVEQKEKQQKNVEKIR